jgi:hypothetical protein
VQHYKAANESGGEGLRYWELVRMLNSTLGAGIADPGADPNAASDAAASDELHQTLTLVSTRLMQSYGSMKKVS